MFEVRGALTEPNSDQESMSVSEASNSSSSCAGNLVTPHSPVSDAPDPEDSLSSALSQHQIYDPLRFPFQNGEIDVRSEYFSESSLTSHPLGQTQFSQARSLISLQKDSEKSLHRRNRTNSPDLNSSSNTFVTSKLHTDPSTMSSQNLSSTTLCNEKDVNKHKSSDKTTNISKLELSLPATEIYEPETVDFPSSPTTFGSLNKEFFEEGVVRLAEGEAEIVKHPTEREEEEEEDKSIYTAIAHPPTGRVTLRKVERPKSLEVQRKRLTVTEELLHVSVDEDQHSVSSLSADDEDEDDDAQMLSHEEFTDMLTPDDIDTPDELEESIMERLGPEPVVEPDPEPSTSKEPTRDEKSWRSVVISGIERRIDMKVIEPYKKVLSHGGYMPGGNNDAIIVFSACFLPDRSRKDYDYVMDHLFMYVLTTLDQLIGEDYVLVYLHGATTRGNMPSFAWLKRCYQMIDRRLRKNLQGLYLVHPTFWVKTVVVMARPFVSSKFARKLRFISSLTELSSLIPLDQVCIPNRVKQYDAIRESLLQKK